MSTDRAERYHAAVTAELDEERAAVLGRVSRKLERARATARDLDERCAASGGRDAALAQERRRAHAEAAELRWVLCIQREAIGLYDHRWVDAVYPPLRPPMG
jgi:hypothetical protein